MLEILLISLLNVAFLCVSFLFCFTSLISLNFKMISSNHLFFFLFLSDQFLPNTSRFTFIIPGFNNMLQSP